MTKFDVYDCLVPVFLETELPKRVVQIGTAIFRELWGELFLFTAAHVTDEHERGTLLVPTVQGLMPIEGYRAYVDLPADVSRGEDTVDIAYYRLSSSFGIQVCNYFKPLPHGRGEIIKSAQDLSICSASGYPATKTKKDSNGAFSSKIYSFRGAVADPDIYRNLELSPHSSIVIQFHKKRALDPETGKLFPTPSLKGISGGAIFAWPLGAELSNDWALPKLVGIVHTFKEREGLIIGTTLLPVMAAISLGRMKKFDGIR